MLITLITMTRDEPGSNTLISLSVNTHTYTSNIFFNMLLCLGPNMDVCVKLGQYDLLLSETAAVANLVFLQLILFCSQWKAVDVWLCSHTKRQETAALEAEQGQSHCSLHKKIWISIKFKVDLLKTLPKLANEENLGKVTEVLNTYVVKWFIASQLRVDLLLESRVNGELNYCPHISFPETLHLEKDADFKCQQRAITAWTCRFQRTLSLWLSGTTSSFTVSLFVSAPVSWCFYVQRSWNISEPRGTYLASCLLVSNCTSSLCALPCHFQSPLNPRWTDLSKWYRVKMLLRGLRFHLHWQLEEHNSAPGGFCEVRSGSSAETEQCNQTIDHNFQTEATLRGVGFLSHWIMLFKSSEEATQRVMGFCTAGESLQMLHVVGEDRGIYREFGVGRVQQ